MGRVRKKSFFFVLLFLAVVSNAVEDIFSSAKSEGSSRALNKAEHSITRAKRQAIGNTSTTSSQESFKDTCKLWVRDPLSGGMNKAVEPNLNPRTNCRRDFRPMTELKTGILNIREEALGKTDECLGRCIHHKSQWENDLGPWLPIANQTFECDFVEANCTKEGVVVEIYIHTQIWERERDSTADTPKEEKPFQPDVYIIVVDSVASPQARRTLPKTLDFLEKNMGAVNFHFLNKIGDNSYPNAFAMTLGWRTESPNRSLTGGSQLNRTHDLRAMCKERKTDEAVIYREYMKNGYKSLHAEDYEKGTMYSFPKCVGFDEQPTTHYYRPFVMEWASPNVSKYMWRENCMDRHTLMLDYTAKFMDSYRDDPKFLIYWASYLGHDNANMIYHSDIDFEKFFRTNEEKMKNAFVFFMADHGVRFGPTADNELGKYEMNNPFLVVTVPERLRNNPQLMKNMKINSEKLLTQFDVHATLVDILKFAPESNFEKWDHVSIFDPNPNNATSFIRPLGKYSERNCNNIPVDSRYCLCHFELAEVSNPMVEEMIADFLVDQINDRLEENNVTDRCQPLTLQKVTSLEGFKPLDETHLYDVVFEVAPSGGRFRASALYDRRRNILMREGDIQRINAYGSDADCVTDKLDMRPFCYCEGLPDKTQLVVPLKVDLKADSQLYIYVLVGLMGVLLIALYRKGHLGRKLFSHVTNRKYTALNEETSPLN